MSDRVAEWARANAAAEREQERMIIESLQARVTELENQKRELQQLLEDKGQNLYIWNWRDSYCDYGTIMVIARSLVTARERFRAEPRDERRSKSLYTPWTAVDGDPDEVIPISEGLVRFL